MKQVSHWDIYAAAGLNVLFNLYMHKTSGINGLFVSDKNREQAVEQMTPLAAEIADLMMKERQKRFPNT